MEDIYACMPNLPLVGRAELNERSSVRVFCCYASFPIAKCLRRLRLMVSQPASIAACTY